MYIDNFYLPKFYFGNEPDVDGFIPDQNALPYDSVDDLLMQQAINDDLSRQLHNYIQQQKPVQNESKRNYIVIDSGNTLSQLAKQYNTTVEDLARLNGIKDINRIKAGQVLRLNNKVSNKYRDYTYTNRTRKPVRNTNAQPVSTNARNYADEAIITAPRRTAPIRTATRRSVNVNQKSHIKSVNTNKYSTNIGQSQQIPIVQYTPESNKNYQNSIRKRNQRRTTTQTYKPRSFFDVILNIGRSINQENKREKQRLEEYDRKHPRQNR